MRQLLAALDGLDFRLVLWLYTATYVLHELEEWNIATWYWQHFVDLPPVTDRSARVVLVTSSLLAVLACAVATVPGDDTVAAYLFMPVIALWVTNALQHIYWLFRFRAYAPGVVSSVLFLIPGGLYLVIRAVQQHDLPILYVVFWAALTVPGLIEAVRAGNRLTGQFRTLHDFGIRLSERLGSPRDGG